MSSRELISLVNSAYNLLKCQFIQVELIPEGEFFKLVGYTLMVKPAIEIYVSPDVSKIRLPHKAIFRVLPTDKLLGRIACLSEVNT